MLIETKCCFEISMEGAHTWRGHRPASTLNRLDLPLPLGPMIMTLRPGGTSKVSSRTSLVPSGEFSATLFIKEEDVTAVPAKARLISQLSNQTTVQTNM